MAKIATWVSGAVLLGAAALAAPAMAGIDFSSEIVGVTEGAPGVFDFSEGGFSDGATVTGFFTGEDLDSDGQLSSFDGEITDFSMHFSGNSLVAAFSLSFSDLFGLVYDLDGGDLGDGTDLDIEGIGAFSFSGAYSAGPGPVALCDGSQICGVVAGPDVGVPEPATWAMLLLGFAAVGGAVRQRRGALV